ncbi:MAG: DUF488 domain-containing protein [Steroidobacteraceae bacterium]
MKTRRIHHVPAREYSSPACFVHELDIEATLLGAADIRVRRIYEKAAKSDGLRVLVDRLWPRGVRKETAALDDWARDLAPSPRLRQWFGHDPKRFAEFRRRYSAELAEKSEELNALARHATREPVTLLYGAKDPEVNHAIVLKNEILRLAGEARVRRGGKRYI